MNLTKKQIGIFAAGLVIVAAIFAWIYFFTAPATHAGSKTITVETVWDSTRNTHVIKTDEKFLGQALRSGGFVQGDEGSMGLYILTVDGRTADSEKQEWWCITKGGEPVSTGSDATPIANGDRFELTLTTGY